MLQGGKRMRIVNGENQTSVSMAQGKRTQEKEGKQENKKGNSIFAGDLNFVEDEITKRKKKLMKDAMKVLMDQYENDSKIDLDMEESRQKIEDSRGRMQDAHTAIQELEQEREKVRERYGVAPDSQEQKDLELIEKAQKASSEGRLDELSEEELERVANLGPLTDYQRESLSYAAVEDEYRKELEAAKNVMLGESRSVEATKRGLLGRKYDMTDAARSSGEMQKRASKEIAGMIYAEAKEHIDEEFKKLQEEAKKAADKKKAEEEATEKTKEAKQKIQEQEEAIREGAKNQEVVMQELKKIAEDQKLLEEDMHGIVIDQYL